MANKSDMLDRKEVSGTEVSKLCAEFFFETSASESRKSINDLFTTLVKQVRHIVKKNAKGWLFYVQSSGGSKVRNSVVVLNLTM